MTQHYILPHGQKFYATKATFDGCEGCIFEHKKPLGVNCPKLPEDEHKRSNFLCTAVNNPVKRNLIFVGEADISHMNFNPCHN